MNSLSWRSATCKSVAINSGGCSSTNKNLGGVKFSVYLMPWMSSWNKTSPTIAKTSCQTLWQCCLANLPNKKYSKASNKLLRFQHVSLHCRPEPPIVLIFQTWENIWKHIQLSTCQIKKLTSKPSSYFPFFFPRTPEPWHRYGYSATWIGKGSRWFWQGIVQNSKEKRCQFPCTRVMNHYP